MKKYFIIFLFPFFLGGAFFWHLIAQEMEPTVVLRDSKRVEKIRALWKEDPEWAMRANGSYIELVYAILKMGDKVDKQSIIQRFKSISNIDSDEELDARLNIQKNDLEISQLLSEEELKEQCILENIMAREQFLIVKKEALEIILLQLQLYASDAQLQPYQDLLTEVKMNLETIQTQKRAFLTQ